MQNNNNIFYYNIVLIFLTMVSGFWYLFENINNKDFEKNYWNISIGVSDKLDSTYQIKLNELTLNNPLDQSYYSTKDNIHLVSENDLIIDNQFGNLILYEGESESLFPNNIRLDYIALQENKAFQYIGEFPYDDLYKQYLELKHNSKSFNYIHININKSGNLEIGLTNYHSDIFYKVKTIKAEVKK